MKHLSEKAINVIGAAFQKPMDDFRLIRLYGPVDRGGVTEWLSKIDLAAAGLDPTPDDLSVYVSLSAWPSDDDNEFAVTFEVGAAVRTAHWVARWEFDSYPLLINSTDVDALIGKAVREPFVGSGISPVLEKVISIEGYKPKNAVDLVGRTAGIRP